MKWRVVMEVTGTDGSVRTHEISGRAPVVEYSPRAIGLSLAESQSMKSFKDCRAFVS
jgi:hypothetical protein